MRPIRRRAILLAAVLGCALVAAGATGGALAAAAGAPPPAGSAGPELAADPAATVANETPPHVDPDEYDEDGDPDDVRGRLAVQLAGQLQRSVDAVNDDEYERARDRVDEAYREDVDRYETLAAESSDAPDETSAADRPSPSAAFDRARTEQRHLIDAVESYDAVLGDYERAVARGDEDSALEHARDLDVAAAEVAAANESLQRQFDAIEAGTAADLGETPETVASIDEEIRETHDGVRSAQFTPTTVSVDAERRSVSPASDVELSGTVRTADRSWPGRETITVEVNGKEHTVDTDRNGQFDLEYRPDPLGPVVDESRVRYRPTPGVDHLGSETTVPLSVEPVEPRLRDFESPDEVTFDEPIEVSGELSAARTSLDGVPVTVAIGETTLGTVETVDGTFEGTVALPASVPDGDHDLVARLEDDDRAITSTAARNPVTVRERETRLSVSATGAETDLDALQVRGTLETTTGAPVANQSVDLAVDGETVATATTAEDGAFEETVSVPEERAEPDDDVSVTATYDGADANLAPTDASTTARLQATASATSRLVDWRTALYALGFLLIVGAALVGAWRLRGYVRDRRRPTRSSHSVLADRSRDATPAGPSAARTDGSSVPPDADLPVTISDSHADTLLERAADQLSVGRTNDAVRSAYAAVRLELQAGVEGGHKLTHWEFLQRYSGPQRRDLESVTEQYERAAFGRESIPEEDASQALVDARALIKLAGDDGPDDLDGIVIED